VLGRCPNCRWATLVEERSCRTCRWRSYRDDQGKCWPYYWAGRTPWCTKKDIDLQQHVGSLVENIRRRLQLPPYAEVKPNWERYFCESFEPRSPLISVDNRTDVPVGPEEVSRFVRGELKHDLRVVFKYAKEGTEYSAQMCWKSRPIEITVRVDRQNTYPYPMRVRGKRNQVLNVELENAKQLALFNFLHEFRHYLDWVDGIDMDGREGSCDMYAVEALGLHPTPGKTTRPSRRVEEVARKRGPYSG